MGKDHELLEAARCGIYEVVEKILLQRTKRSGPLASLRRGPGANIQDNNGYTSLHHACLNNHKDIVILLLNYEASANIVDHKGCTPLHLAAWSGNTEIVEILLKHGPSFPSINHMNFDHESALHSAAQYGHTDIVKLLLENGCYVSVRNVRNESPLDLASQYGRIETVDCLLNSHCGLHLDTVRCHSPLHLASKNGHRHVVKLLLDSGFDVNYLTDNGSALHEAAMYGKIDVVKLLLDYGIDSNLENASNRTVLDVLGDMNTCISKNIEKLISDHNILINIGNEYESLSPIMPPRGFFVGSHFGSLLPEKSNLPGITPPHQFCSPSHGNNVYDCSPSSNIMETSCRNGSICSLSAAQSEDSCCDQTFCTSYNSPKCATPETAPLENNFYQNAGSDSLLYEIPPPPSFLSIKRFSDPLQQGSIYQNVFFSERNDNNVNGSYIQMLTGDSVENNTHPPVKPPRKSTGSLSSETKMTMPQRNSYEFLCLASSGSNESALKFFDRNKNSHRKRNVPLHYTKEDYIEMSLNNKPIPTYENHDVICSNVLDRSKVSSCVETKMNAHHGDGSGLQGDGSSFTIVKEDPQISAISWNNLISSKSTPALHASRHTLDKIIQGVDKESDLHKSNHLTSINQLNPSSLSPPSYNELLTPDNQPPSPGTAQIGIHEKIHPNHQNSLSKFLSRDVDTVTDEELVTALGPHGEVELILATDNKCVSTENESSQNGIFAGLHYGSLSASAFDTNSRQPIKHIEKQSSSRSHNIYENVKITIDHPRHDMTVNESDMLRNGCLSITSPFDEKAEWAEIAGIISSYGGCITRESVVSQDIESKFSETGLAVSEESHSFKDLEEWLKQIGLSQYENILVINGFDDINFLGGNIMEDSDLQEIGIQNECDRQKLCSFAEKLPAFHPISVYEESDDFPESIDEWLKSLNLLEYSENFSNNNISDMNRAVRLWEVELNTVLKIQKIGHRKRILASLSDKHFYNIEDSKSLDLSKLSEDLTELENLNHNYCNTPAFLGYGCKVSVEKPYLRIRSPTQLMSDSPVSNQVAHSSDFGPQWCHHPDVLVYNNCSYMAKYLGSTLVKELNGLISTRTSILKLKTSTKDIAKIPSIVLSISYSGVKFINADNQKLVCEHEIRNIHCACQDADDLRHFAYITKDLQTHNHYCHVFSSQNVDMASEIILTLGEAFEVAYQIAMNEKEKRVSSQIGNGSKNLQTS